MGKPKQIFLKETVPANDCEHLLGTFLDDSHYDLLIEEDCDVYKPIPDHIKNKFFDSELLNLENYLLLKFRKNVFPEDMQKEAYVGLREAAVESQNRGIAAGSRTEKSTGRDWVTILQEKVIDILSEDSTPLPGEDPVADAFLKYGNSNEVGARGSVWLTGKKPANFNFVEWANATKKLSYKDRIKEVEKINDCISDTSYANPVYSGIAGYFDRYPRIPYCRTTAYTSHQGDKFAAAVPFIEKISEKFKELVPGRWENQNKEVSKLDRSFKIGNSVYTTITVNKSYRTAAHRDAGDLPTGFGNLAVLSDGNPYNGCYTLFPKFRVAVNVRPGDLVMMNVHEIHGNTKFEGEGERISIVCYMREKMAECKTKSYEDCRYRFVESRRLNQDHPLWHEHWNGVSSGMWKSEEWRDYLMENGLHEYADQLNISSGGVELDI